MVVVKKLMLESLLNFRFRKTTLNHKNLLIALGKLSTLPTTKKVDTSAPMDIGMAAMTHSESGDQRILDIALQSRLQRNWRS